MITALDAVKMAYRKHVMNDPSIGWEELSDALMMAICNETSDQEFHAWLRHTSQKIKHIKRIHVNARKHIHQKDGN